MAASTDRSPAPAIVRTANFALDRLGGAADEAALARWLRDPRITHAFGQPPPALDPGVIGRFVASFDGRAGLLLAIRDVGGGPALGFYLLRADPANRTLRVSVAVGERTALGRGVVRETGPALADWVFGRTRTEKVILEILESNRLTRRAVAGWFVEEGRLRGEVPCPRTGRRLTIIRYGLLREDWERGAGPATAA